ncbi:MAG: hypothetical protein SH818_11045 [Saprospiraceae bacterium]|nr:hypothetical protein [Saprospiraceae bacterium]
MSRYYLPLFLMMGMLIGLQNSVPAQMPNDAIYMNKNTICVMAAYGQNSWDEYWENTLKRENLNIGTNTTQMYMVMVAAGITDKLNLLAGLPYVQTKNSAGNLLGQKGLQDLSATLKYKFFENHGLSLHGALGGSIPMSNYIPDFLPMSIGIGSTTLTGRIIANYKHHSGIYITLHGGYTGRNNINIDRDTYQAYDRVYNTSEVAIPNTADGGINLGYLKNGIQATLFMEKFDCIGGDAIRRNDMPFPTNNMVSNNVGAFLKYQPSHFGINGRIAYVTSGQNVGQALSFMAGILYQFSIKGESVGVSN